MTRDPLIGHLAELCRQHPTRAKWLIVPAHAVGVTLTDRLARETGGWANLRVATPLDLATRVAAPFLLERGLDPSEEGLGGALVMRLLLDMGGEGGYFRPMAHHSSMGDALWRAIRELRYAGVRAADLAARRFTTVAAKRAELAALLDAYEAHLRAAGVADMPMVFEEALRHGEWFPVGPTDLVVELPGVQWPLVVRRFLDALPGERRQAPAPVRWPDGATAAQTTLFHAGGRDAEIDEIFRRIVASGVRLDQVEIACSASVPPSLVYEKASRLEWPVTVAAGVPAATTRPGRLLLRYCDWVESDFDAAELRRLLQSGDCWSKGFGGDEADLSPGQAARLLLRAEATWGRETYALALKRRAEEYEHRAAEPESSEPDRAWNARKGRQAEALLAWVTKALERIPAPEPGGNLPLRSVADAAAGFLQDNAARWEPRDNLALQALVSAVQELRALGDYRCPLATAVRFLRERAASVTIGRDRPRPGHLHVSTLDAAGTDGRPYLFVAGLEEGAVFAAPVEDPVLLDEERRALAEGLLPTSPERQAREVEATLAALATAAGSAGQVCYSFSCRDTREFRETFPSWMVLEAFRLQQGNKAFTYADLKRHLGEAASPVPASPAQARTDAAWWLAHRSVPAAPGAILHAFPSLARGQAAMAGRESARFTVYDGLVPEAGPVLDPARTGRPVSATTLEDAAKCPLRFFMRQGLGVRPIEEGRGDGDAWLEPLTKGGELHALYARVMRAARAEGRPASLAIDQPRLQEWGRERLEALAREMPPPSDEVFARESREFLEDLDAFITAECEGRHGPDPVGFEVAFGFPLGGEQAEPLASEELVDIPIGDGRRLWLHGRIDRINRLEGHEYEVVDYKGSYWRDDWVGRFRGGTLLQHALYGVAAARLLKQIDKQAQVVRGTYLFPRVRGSGAKRPIPAPSAAVLAEVLRDLSDVIGSGAFAPADREGACRWCEYGAACHATDIETAKTKVNDEQNAALAAYRKLRAHE